ncbi:sulfur carrier protein ThiS [Paracoccus haematequi]|jgi:thiamine biosynthesis protein ThiS|uniref:Sulfur carrier protein ThiS n=1 Tax=Paracoccus haematequi TaxID=2491866 RepID=A0A447IMM8_9RHOB|nr:sulfur carrier protein ThiS [Paracoccus haematequi]VDS08783.1 sulfur carrier protein ThiS [Paracoccus haematequi]
MRITINGTPRDVAATTLAGALAEADLTGRIATALNGSFVPAALRETTPLRDGDAIEALAPMQGG